MFVRRVNNRTVGANVDHAGFLNALLNSAKDICGEIMGRRQRETWWWNEEVQQAVKEKKLAFKKWTSEGTEKAHEQ